LAEFDYNPRVPRMHTGSTEGIRFMSLREEYVKKHPDFPWLSAEEPDGVEAYLRQAGWLEPNEHVKSCRKAGEGNMNLTLLVEADRWRAVLKQARPWVEKYDTIAAPWDRGQVEQAWYRAVEASPIVHGHMPEIYQTDPEARVILMEALEDAEDFTDLYATGEIDADTIETLSAYLAALHHIPVGKLPPLLANREMRELNHAHLFVVPMDTDNGIDLEQIEPGLSAAAAALREDEDYRKMLAFIGEHYRGDGPALLHGDFFPGSWMKTKDGLRVIDPEFGFLGDPETDLGIMIGHLRLAGCPVDAARHLLRTYHGESVRKIDDRLIARYAAVEIMRRILGVAQLPLRQEPGYRARRLRASRAAMINGSLDALW